FGPLAELNGRLNRLVHAQGEGAISTLLKAAKEQGGDTTLLAQLQRSMPAAEFQHIGGQLLYELGHQPATGEFSLAKFVTEFEKLSPRARGILFEPNHLRGIENIVQMGRHIKGALKESSTSHSANLLVLLDVAKDAALLAHDIANQGLPGAGAAIGAGTTAGLWGLTHWLANPAQAAAVSRWTTAYRAITLG